MTFQRAGGAMEVMIGSGRKNIPSQVKCGGVAQFLVDEGALVVGIVDKGVSNVRYFEAKLMVQLLGLEEEEAHINHRRQGHSIWATSRKYFPRLSSLLWWQRRCILIQ